MALAARILALVLWTTCFALAVNPVDQSLRMTLRADLLHVDLGLQVVGAMSRDCIGEVPAEPV